MSKKKNLYIGDSSDDDPTTYSTSGFNKKISKIKSKFISSFLLEEISHSILYNQGVVANYVNKKNALSEKLIIDNHPNVDSSFLGKYLSNKLNENDLMIFYRSHKNSIESIQQKLTININKLKLDYKKATTITRYDDYELLHNFLQSQFGVNLKDKLLTYCNKKNKSLGLSNNIKDYNSLIEILKTSTNNKQKILSNYCNGIFKDTLATIKPNTKSAQRFLTDALKFKNDKDLMLYSKHIGSISYLLQNLGDTQNSVQVLATKIYIEQLNVQNITYSNTLEQLRPKKFYTEDKNYGIEYLSDFKLDHKILRNKIKTAGISKQGDTITHNVGIKQIHNNPCLFNYQISETNNIYGTASRSDEVCFAPSEGSYSKITEYLQNSSITGTDLAKCIKSILKTGYVENKYIGQLTYLLFKCEPERNASAFLTNAMFLELLENGIYTIEDIPNKMPMAMSDAVDATRSLLDQLGGKYGENSPYLTKRQYYDFKDGNDTKAQELAGRDTLILLDWLNLKIHTDKDFNLDHDVVADESSIRLKYFLAQKDDSREAKSLDNFLKIKEENDRATRRIDLTKYSNKNILNFTDSLNSFVKDMLNKDSPNQKIFKAFHNLIYDWYGIRLDWLYSFIEFKSDNEKEFFSNDSNLTKEDFNKWCTEKWNCIADNPSKETLEKNWEFTDNSLFSNANQDIYAIDNATNKAKDQLYQYQGNDIRYIGKQLFDPLKETINWIGDIGKGHQDLDASNLLPDTINKPIVGVYNIGNFHWIGFAIKKVDNDFIVFYKDSLNGQVIDISFKKLITDKYSQQGEISYFAHAGNEQTESEKTSCGVFALKNTYTLATKLHLQEIGTSKENCKTELGNITFTGQGEIEKLRQDYGDLYALEFAIQLQDSYKTNIIKEIIRNSHIADIEALVGSIKKELEETDFTNLNIIAINGNDTFDNHKNKDSTIGIEVYLADQNLLHLENYVHYVQIHCSSDLNQDTLLGQFNNLSSNLKTIPLSGKLGIIYDQTQEKQGILLNAKLKADQDIQQEEIQKKLTDETCSSLGIEIIKDQTVKDFLKEKLETCTKNQFKGITNEGLNLQSIEFNLGKIIEVYKNNSDFYISSKLMSIETVISDMTHWQMSSNYGGLVGIENELGNKHAVLLTASKVNGQPITVTITDSLSEDNSIFKSEMEQLAQLLTEQEAQKEVSVNIVYSGIQDKDYGTCADVSLIMLQELLEKTHNIQNAVIPDQNLHDLQDMLFANHENNQFLDFYTHVSTPVVGINSDMFDL